MMSKQKGTATFNNQQRHAVQGKPGMQRGLARKHWTIEILDKQTPRKHIKSR